MNSDPGFHRAINPNMALGSSTGPDGTVSLGSIMDHRDQHVLVAGLLLDANRASGGSLDP